MTSLIMKFRLHMIWFLIHYLFFHFNNNVFLFLVLLIFFFLMFCCKSNEVRTTDRTRVVLSPYTSNPVTHISLYRGDDDLCLCHGDVYPYSIRYACPCLFQKSDAFPCRSYEMWNVSPCPFPMNASSPSPYLSIHFYLYPCPENLNSNYVCACPYPYPCFYLCLSLYLNSLYPWNYCGAYNNKAQFFLYKQKIGSGERSYN